jgi:hypothetical protein
VEAFLYPLADLVAAMEAGNTYANAHTNDGVDGVNTGPGDRPGGESAARSADATLDGAAWAKRRPTPGSVGR